MSMFLFPILQLLFLLQEDASSHAYNFRFFSYPFISVLTAYATFFDADLLDIRFSASFHSSDGQKLRRENVEIIPSLQIA